VAQQFLKIKTEFKSIVSIISHVCRFVFLRLSRIPFSEFLLIVLGLFLVISKQWISDDGYINFRYVDNLVIHKIGLVYNRGEFVEGFTSPLWVGILSLCRFFLPFVQLRHMTFIICWIVAFFTFFLLGHLNRAVLSKLFAGTGISAATYNFSTPLLFVVCTAVVTDFFTSGLETPLIILFSVLVGYELLVQPRKLWLCIFLAGIAPLIRNDLVLFSCLILVARLGTVSRSTLIKMVLLSITPIFLYELFRVWYYAALLPNTYYTKASLGSYWSQGFLYLRDLFDSYYSYIPLLAVLLSPFLIAILCKNNRSQLIWSRLYLVTGVILHSIYVVWVGGDFMHGRFFIAPLVLCYCGLSGIGELLAWRFVRIERQFASVLRVLVLLVFCTLLLPLHSIQEGMSRPDNISNEREWYMMFDNQHLSDWNFIPQNDPAKTALRLNALAKRSSKQITILGGSIGYLGYYAGPNITILDTLGLVDSLTAHIIPKQRAKPGHEKIAPLPYLMIRQPTIWWTPFTEYNDLMKLIPEEGPITAFDPTLLVAFNSITNRNNAKDVREKILQLLQKPTLDANLLFFLKNSAALDADLQEIIDKKYRTITTSSSWDSWLTQYSKELSLLEQQRSNQHNFWENLHIAFKAHFIAVQTLQNE